MRQIIPPSDSRRITKVGHRARNVERRFVVGDWHYVGAAGEPAFQNSWANAGGSLQTLRFRDLGGAGLEIQGSVTGGASGTAVFTIPADFPIPASEIRLAASDDTGLFIVVRVLATGDVVVGV